MKFMSLRVFYCLIICLLLYVSCAQDDNNQLIGQSSSKVENRSFVKEISSKDIPKVMGFLRSTTNERLQITIDDSDNPDLSHRNHEENLVISSVLEDQIKQVTNGFGKSNYTFKLIQEETKEGAYFLNLIVKEYRDTHYMYIVKYVADDAWYLSYISTQDFTTFTGTVYYYTSEGKYFGKLEMLNGSSNHFERNSCDSNNNDGNGGGNGGGNGDSGTGDSGTGDGGNDGSSDSGDGSGSDGGGSGEYTCDWEVSEPTCEDHEPGAECGGMIIVITLNCQEMDFGADTEAQSFNDYLRNPCDSDNNDCGYLNDCEFGWDDDCNCLDEPEENNDIGININFVPPCPGDPLHSIELAHQLGASGWKGGMFGNNNSPGGCTRFGANHCPTPRNKAHNGLDLISNYGQPIYAMYDGVASKLTQRKNGNVVGAGHYVSITSIVNGEEITILYFHLQEDNRFSGNVEAGQIIGFQGDSGNLKNAIRGGNAVSHLHIKVKDENGFPLDPRFYLGTNMDVNGNVTQNTNCN